MTFLNSHRGAVLITVLVVILSIGFGAHRSLTAVRTHIADVFTDGVAGDGHSIASDLKARADVCANLSSVAQHYLGSDSEQITNLDQARTTLLDDLTDAAADQNVTNAANAVFDALDGCDLSEKDAKYVDGFRSELTSRAFSIAHDGYNTMAVQFNKVTLGAFPASLLRHMIFVSELPLYQ
ncbi:MAG: hypothetical protein LKK00_02785 [Intestinimonas sp.]|jgi:hypothetical protein|nr:hypothetical protein [Intestinimonas sp.]